MEKLLQLLKADHIGSRECRERMKEIFEEKKTNIVTVNGKPQYVMVPYDEILALFEDLAKQEGRLSHA